MKKILAILLACMLLLGGVALADRERIITVMGAEETITEYEYISESGYSIWVDGAHFVQAEGLGEGTEMFTDVVGEGEVAKLMILMAQTEVANEEAGTYILEAVANYPQDMVSEVSFVELETGLKYHTVSAHEDGINFVFYTIEGNGGLLCITVAYPIAMEETHFERVQAMIESITILDTDVTYTGAEGYTLQYSAAQVQVAEFAETDYAYFIPAATAEGETPAASLLLVKSDVAWEDAEGYLGEAVAMYENVTDVQTVSGDLEYMSRTATENGVTYCFYAVKAADGIICGTAVYPEADTAGYAAIFGAMIASITF